MDTVKAYIKKFDQELAKNQYLLKLESQTGVPKVYLVSGLIVIAFIMLQFSYLALFLVNVCGFAVGAYFSLHAAKDNAGQLNGMLFFMFFSFILLIEENMYALTSLIPFYPLIKGGAIGWMVMPKYRGATFLFNSVTRNLCPALNAAIPFCSDKSAAGTKTAADSCPLSKNLSKAMNEAVNTPLKHD